MKTWLFIGITILSMVIGPWVLADSQFNYGETMTITMEQRIPHGWIVTDIDTIWDKYEITYIQNAPFSAQLTIPIEFKRMIPDGWLITDQDTIWDTFTIENVRGARPGTTLEVLAQEYRHSMPRNWVITDEDTIWNKLTIQYMGARLYQPQRPIPSPREEEPVYHMLNPDTQSPMFLPPGYYQRPIEPSLEHPSQISPIPNPNACRYAGWWYNKGESICIMGDTYLCSLHSPGAWSYAYRSCTREAYRSDTVENSQEHLGEGFCYDSQSRQWYSKGSVLCRQGMIYVCSLYHNGRWDTHHGVCEY